MRIYFDVCALGRLFDDQKQPRMAAEALAVQRVLTEVANGYVHWITSSAVYAEVEKNSDPIRRELTLRLLGRASEKVVSSSLTEQRANEVQQSGFKYFDAQHLAIAESANVYALLTTDDRMIRAWSRTASSHRSILRVLNPVDWLHERSR